MNNIIVNIFSVDVNVISVDWSRVDEGRINNFLYWKAVKNCELIGSHVADFLAFLDQAYDSFSLESTHIIGHSLGAHIAGFVGKHLDGGIGKAIYWSWLFKSCIWKFLFKRAGDWPGPC